MAISQNARVAADPVHPWRAVLRSLVLLLGLAGAAYALHEIFGAWAPGDDAPDTPLTFVAWATLGCAIGLPRQITALAGGTEFGFGEGVALAMAAQCLACIIDFGWSRFVARDFVHRRLSGRLRRFDGFLSARPFLSTLTLRLLPVGNNLLLCLAAGVSGMRALPFLAASVIGYLPQTIVFALAGSGSRIGHAGEIAVAVLLFLVSAALGVWLLRHRPEAAATLSVES